MSHSLADLMAPDWAAALEPVADQITAMGEFLRAEVAAGRGYLPAADDVLRAFAEPLSGVKVLIVGQDPYPTPGHAMGLSFSVRPDVRPLPPSLRNIYAELQSDCAIAPPPTGDLTPWARRGVLLLNRVLSVEPRVANSHRGRGWEAVTEQAIMSLVARDHQPLVAVLWGKEAQELAPMLRETPVISSPHPSPLSAWRGFFGTKPFSRTNALLQDQGSPPVDWSLHG